VKLFHYAVHIGEIDKLTLAGFFKMAFAQLLIFRGFTYAVESLISTYLK